MRNKLYASINILGLAIGIASFLFISLYIYNELCYDTFWENSDRIYRVDAAWTWPDGESRYATAPPPLAPRMELDIPEIKLATRILKRGDFTFRPETNHDRIFRETNVYLADENYFLVFSDRLLQGNAKTVLAEPLSIVISESAAKRYFGEKIYDEESLIGRSILGGKDVGTAWKITGIMKDVPLNSHQDFEIVVPMSGWWKHNDNWGWNIMHTYVLIEDNVIIEDATDNIRSKLDDIVRSHTFSGKDRSANTGEGLKYYLMPLKSIHLHSDFLGEMKPNGNITMVYIFGLVAILILIVACVNFTNLATALSVKRAKEVGVHKVLGSGRTSLTIKFLVEAMLYSAFATLLALVAVELFILFASPSLGINLVTGIFDRPEFIIGTLVIMIGSGLLAGFYPALIISKYQPSESLKGAITIKSKGFSLRNSLVVFQFTASIGLILSSSIISEQLDYIRASKLGFDKENVLVIQNDREIDEERMRFKELLLPHYEILDVSFSTGIPALDRFMVRDYALEDESASMGLRWFEIDHDFISTMNLKLIEGKNFQRGSVYDSMGIVLNEQAVEELGLVDPIGKNIVINRGEDDERTVHVTGVVENFHFESLHKIVKPLGMEFLRDYTFKDYISIKIAPGKTMKAVELIKDAWHTLEPQVPITYSFLESDFDALYQAEVKLQSVFNIFSSLTLIIAGLGLFGLATYTAQQRQKEISIRKVLGASVSTIMALLLKNFFALACTGLILASVMVIFFAERWLSSFAFRTTLGIEQFTLAFIATSGILLVSVLYQTFKAALSNPVDSIKED
ncbi:MAG: ABC transporter permease [Bacteroidota bacterium]